MCPVCGTSFVESIPHAEPIVNYPRSVQTYPPGTIQVPPGSHSMVAVIVLSILFGGWAGMLVNRQIAKGLIYGLLLGSILGFATCGIGLIIWYPLTLIDALLVAQKLNQGKAIKEWEFF
jgi:hypothetical protein